MEATNLERTISAAQKKADNGYPYSAFCDLKKIVKENFPALVDWGMVEKLVMEK